MHRYGAVAMILVTAPNIYMRILWTATDVARLEAMIEKFLRVVDITPSFAKLFNFVQEQSRETFLIEIGSFEPSQFACVEPCHKS